MEEQDSRSMLEAVREPKYTSYRSRGRPEETEQTGRTLDEEWFTEGKGVEEIPSIENDLSGGEADPFSRSEAVFEYNDSVADLHNHDSPATEWIAARLPLAPGKADSDPDPVPAEYFDTQTQRLNQIPTLPTGYLDPRWWAHGSANAYTPFTPTYTYAYPSAPVSLDQAIYSAEVAQALPFVAIGSVHMPGITDPVPAANEGRTRGKKKGNPRINAPCPICGGSRLFKMQSALDSHMAQKHADGQRYAGPKGYGVAPGTVATTGSLVPRLDKGHHGKAQRRASEGQGYSDDNPSLYMTNEIALAERMFGELEISEGSHSAQRRAGEGLGFFDDNPGLYMTKEEEIALAEQVFAELETSRGSKSANAGPNRKSKSNGKTKTKTKPSFYCAICDTDFRLQDGLTSHALSVHNLRVGRENHKVGLKKGMVVRERVIVLGEGDNVHVAGIKPWQRIRR